MKQKLKEKEKLDTKLSLAERIDTAYLLDVEVKEKTALLKKEKESLKGEAKSQEVKVLEGEIAQLLFSDETKSLVDPYDLFLLCGELGIEDKYWEMVKVNLTAAKSLVGELALDSIINTEYVEYAKARFKTKGYKNVEEDKRTETRAGQL